MAIDEELVALAVEPIATEFPAEALSPEPTAALLFPVLVKMIL